MMKVSLAVAMFNTREQYLAAYRLIRDAKSCVTRVTSCQGHKYTTEYLYHHRVVSGNEITLMALKSYYWSKR